MFPEYLNWCALVCVPFFLYLCKNDIRRFQEHRENIGFIPW